MSRLGTVDRAALRLTCHAMRSLAPHNKRVTLRIGKYYTAEAAASPQLLELMDLVSRWDCSFLLGCSRDDACNRNVETTIADASASVAPDVASLQVGFKAATITGPVDDKFNIIYDPRVFLAHTSQLMSLCVEEGSLSEDDVLQLSALSQLSSIDLATLPGREAFQLMSSVLGVSRLVLRSGNCSPTGFARVALETIAELTTGRLAASLQELSLPCPVAAIQGLTALSRLSALQLRIRPETSNPLAELTCMSQLLSLSMNLEQPRVQIGHLCSVEALSPLTALSGLTSLHLNDGERRGWKRLDLEITWIHQHSWMSGLSCLTALRAFGFSRLRMPTGLQGETLLVSDSPQASAFFARQVLWNRWTCNSVPCTGLEWTARPVVHFKILKCTKF